MLSGSLVVFAHVIAALTVAASAACTPVGYNCINTTTYSYCGTDGNLYKLNCPQGTQCIFNGTGYIPCNNGEVLSTPYTPNYKCDATKCNSDHCRCASSTPPIANPLQLVTFTVDDGISSANWNVISQIIDYGHKNPNGCNITFTWFMSFDNDPPCNMIPYIPARDSEIADHTYHHVGYAAIDEMEQGRTLLSQCAKIPASSITGFRPPYLQQAPWTLDAMMALNLTYLSGSEDSYEDAGGTIGKKLWPYTLDYGQPGICSSYCGPGMVWPGIWSIPMVSLDDPNGTSLAMMDPNYTGSALHDIYMQNFNANYNGNRAPFGIYIHSPYLIEDPTRIATLNQIISEMLQMKDVWFVAMDDVIRYMKNPVPSGSLSPPFRCPGKPLPNITTPVPSVANQTKQIPAPINITSTVKPPDKSTGETPAPPRRTDPIPSPPSLSIPHTSAAEENTTLYPAVIYFCLAVLLKIIE